MTSYVGAAYRHALFGLKGLVEYTRYGFVSASRRFNQAHLEEDISNLSYMITGANSGIGRCTALALAKKGATVHMVCRNPSRGEEAKQSIITESGNDKVQLHILDMSKPRDIIQFATSFNQPLDVLVNNAGCILFQRKLTEDSLETNFAVNCFGPYLLTTRLIKVLEKSPSPRVVSLSSAGILLTKLDPDILNFGSGESLSYTYLTQHKRQLTVMTKKWAEKYPNIFFSTTHPGWANTPGADEAVPMFSRYMGNYLRTPEQGADNVIWLCVAKSATMSPNGGFFQDRRMAAEHLPLGWTQHTEEEEDLLMKNLEELAKKFNTD